MSLCFDPLCSSLIAVYHVNPLHVQTCGSYADSYSTNFVSHTAHTYKFSTLSV